MTYKKQYTLSDRIAQRLDHVSRLYDRPPESLIDEAIEAMYAAVFRSYSVATRNKMLKEVREK